MENADFKLMMKSMHENTTKVIRDLLDTYKAHRRDGKNSPEPYRENGA